MYLSKFYFKLDKLNIFSTFKVFFFFNWYTLFTTIFQVWKCMLASSNMKVLIKNA